MNQYVFEPAQIPTLSMDGSTQLFPIRRVYCIGRNYAAHSIEMGGDPNRESPFFFQKNPDNLDSSGEFPFPPESEDVHHELELLVALKSGGDNISKEIALSHIFGYGLALDMTRRDLQAEAKATRRPWEISKAFERSAPVSSIMPASIVGHPKEGEVRLSVNGIIRQQGNLNQMIWKVPEIIAYLSKYFSLAAGDIILTGTPSGVGPVNRGDQLECSIQGIGQMVVKVV